jgi:hypothetical protein
MTEQCVSPQVSLTYETGCVRKGFMTAQAHAVRRYEDGVRR